MSSPPADDYYTLLGVSVDASEGELRRAWRQQVLRWHPDLAGEAATPTFQRLAGAYAVLSDPIARAAYNRRRHAAAPPPAAPSPGARTARPPTPAIMLSRISGPLPSLVACGAARLDEPGYITLVLGEADAAQGGMAAISLRVELWCPGCGGKEGAAACGRCGGRGTVDELFSAWLAVPPGVAAGEVLAPSVELPGMVEPVRFRIRRAAAR